MLNFTVYISSASVVSHFRPNVDEKNLLAISMSRLEVILAIPALSISAYSSLFLPMTNLRSTPSILAKR